MRRRLFLTLAAAVPASASLATAVAPEEGPLLVHAELTPAMSGKEVWLSFQAEKEVFLTGSVPAGTTPTSGLQPKRTEGAPRMMVLISGDLSELMQRFSLSGIGALKGTFIHAGGKLEVFPARKDHPEEGPSYQLTLREWKKFRLLPSQRA